MVKELIAIDILDAEGRKRDPINFDIGSLDISKAERVISDVAVQMLANSKKHTARVKSRSEVDFTNRKPWKQKGTGRARAGSARSPLWVGGGVAHGPKARDSVYSIPRKLRLKAAHDAFFLKVKAGEVVILEEASVQSGKTRDAFALLKTINRTGRVLFITEKYNPEFVLAVRNIPKAGVSDVASLSVVDLIGNAHLVFITRAAFDAQVRKFNTREGGSQ